ncbi:MAG: TPM domain-containing protein [Tissierellia bacterium]|nr:TPM domain-containing protein [Tissierellia bacterium]
MKRFLILFVTFLLMTTTVIYGKDVPPRPNHNYYDELNVLSQETKSYVDTSDKQAVIVTIADLEGEDAHEYGVKIFEHWGIGHKGADDGVLVLLAYDSVSEKRYIQIITGAGREAVITDARAGKIIDQYMLDDLKAGNYDAALLAGIKKLEEYYEYPDRAEELDTRQSSHTFSILLTLILSIFLRIPFKNQTFSKKASLGKGKEDVDIERQGWEAILFLIGTFTNVLSLVLSFLYNQALLIFTIGAFWLFNSDRFRGGSGRFTGGGFGSRGSGGFSSGGFSSGGSSFGGGSTSGGGAGRSF